MYYFSLGYDTADVSDVVDIHKYLNEKIRYKIIFRLIKQEFMVLLCFRGSLPTKCISLIMNHV